MISRQPSLCACEPAASTDAPSTHLCTIIMLWCFTSFLNASRARWHSIRRCVTEMSECVLNVLLQAQLPGASVLHGTNSRSSRSFPRPVCAARRPSAAAPRSERAPAVQTCGHPPHCSHSAPAGWRRPSNSPPAPGVAPADAPGQRRQARPGPKAMAAECQAACRLAQVGSHWAAHDRRPRPPLMAVSGCWIAALAAYTAILLCRRPVLGSFQVAHRSQRCHSARCTRVSAANPPATACFAIPFHLTRSFIGTLFSIGCTFCSRKSSEMLSLSGRHYGLEGHTRKVAAVRMMMIMMMIHHQSAAGAPGWLVFLGALWCTGVGGLLPLRIRQPAPLPDAPACS